MPTKLIDLEAALRIADELDDMPSSFKSRDPDGDYCDGWRAACGEMAEALRALPAATGAIEHCRDCCCAKSWEALGLSSWTGKSIPEHIRELVASRPTGAVDYGAARKKAHEMGWIMPKTVSDAIVNAALRPEGEPRMDEAKRLLIATLAAQGKLQEPERTKAVRDLIDDGLTVADILELIPHLIPAPPTVTGTSTGATVVTTFTTWPAGEKP